MGIRCSLHGVLLDKPMLMLPRVLQITLIIILCKFPSQPDIVVISSCGDTQAQKFDLSPLLEVQISPDPKSSAL